MEKASNLFLLAFVLLIISAPGCLPAVKKTVQTPQEALQEVRCFPEFRDDMDRESLILAVRRNLEYLNHISPETVFHYGPRDFTCRQVRETQEAFLSLLSKGLDPDQLNREMKKKFRVYRATGRAGEGRVLFTGYYEPTYEGSLSPDETFKYPLYRPPDDLVKIDLSPFGERFKGESIVGKIEGRKVEPYLTRRQIEAEKALQGKALEIAWLRDPLDVAFLHVQGSGRLRLPDGKEVLVQYQASNGWPYRSIGQHMIERGFLAPEEISMQSIRRYLAKHPELLDEVLNYNPSYVFFQRVDSGPLGSLGVLLTPGRSVALDARIFPQGALGFISSQKPLLNDQGEILRWVEFSRFVLNQDSGAAIKGSGRADIFWGTGPYAEVAAGYLRHEGDLYILIKKP